MYPVLLSLRERRCLVVGGGPVAERKVRGLLEEGARVVVVAEDVTAELEARAARGELEWRPRRYESGEVAGYAIVFAATDDRAVNQQVFLDAESAGIWANVADDPPLCHFHLPARIRRGDLELAIGTGGRAPFLSRRLREVLERRIGERWSAWMDAAGSLREEVRTAGLDAEAADAVYDRFVAETLDPLTLSVRVPEAAERRRWIARADVKIESRPRRGGGHVGTVSLVGAGPGCPGLLTLRGRQRLLAADVVVYDRLAEPALPCDLPSRVELISVGKQAGHHPVPQPEINQMLIRFALEGRNVVRFKGGDPYVFGRGGEECEALRAAGVPFEVVHGVTSGIAVPGYAGIPVTCREEVVRLTFITAHESIKREGPQMSWRCLAADKHATLVGYMGVSSLPNVARKLIAAGMDPQMPAAIIERGTTSGQRSVTSTLVRLAEDAEKAGIKPPGMFVIGPTVRHSRSLDWLARLPLAGKRIVVPHDLAPMAEALEVAGAEVVPVPLPPTSAARIVVAALPVTAWVAQSARDVRTWLELAAPDPTADEPGARLVCLGREAEDEARALNLEVLAASPEPGDDASVAALIVEALGDRA